MTTYQRFLQRGAAARLRRVVSSLALGLALIALIAAIWPTRVNAEVAPTATGETILTPPTTATLRGTTRVTPASHAVSAALAQQAAVDTTFQTYYAANDGALFLGAPLTPAFLTKEGLTQFFENGALLLHIALPAQTTLGDDAPQNPATIEWLPLLASLLQLGSTAPVGGDSSTFTYLDLRRAVLDAPLITRASAPQNDSDDNSVFVASAESNGNTYGQLVPAAIWAYLQRTDISPQGWQVAFGAPLTAALPVLATVDGTLRRELVQVFTNGAVVLDETAASDDNDDNVYRLPTGLAYLETAGMPAVVVREGTSFWAARDTAILPNPASGGAEVHVGQNFPLTLTGTSAWVDGALWYGINWQTPGRSGTGWLAATDGTLVAPNAGSPPTAGFDLLSADLQTYLEQFGNRVGAYVFDLTRNATYSYNASGLFTVASSVKVPIMLTFLTMTERQNREPNSNEMALLTTMIENSNNDSAQALWDEVGGGPAVASYLRTVGVTDFHPNNIDGWGWSTISPLSMVHLLTLLHDGKVLTAQDRQLALYLMNNIESDEQTGVGDTAPPGAAVEMKDGWVPGPDGLWVMNTTGIVTLGSETYIISIYTQDDDSLQQGWDITRHVCQVVGQLLT